MSDKTSKKWTYDNVRDGDANTMKRLRQDAEQGDGEALYLLDLLEREAKDKARHKEIAETLRKTVEERRNVEIEKYRQAAEQGDAEAQYRLGLVYCEVFREQAEDDTFVHLRPLLHFEIPSDKKRASLLFQKAAKQGHPKAQEWTKRDRQEQQRQQLVSRLREIARTNTVATDFPGAMCYIIVPFRPTHPSPARTTLYDLLTRLGGKTITNRSIFIARLHGKLFERPIPEKYQDVYDLLQQSGLSVGYSENEEHNGLMVFHLPGVEDIILEPIPDVSTLEMMVRFLENDTSITIEDIENRLLH